MCTTCILDKVTTYESIFIKNILVAINSLITVQALKSVLIKVIVAILAVFICKLPPAWFQYTVNSIVAIAICFKQTGKFT